MNTLRSIFIIYWLWCRYTTLASVGYTSASNTTNGEPCLTQCRNGRCAVDYFLFTQPCYEDPDARVPIYHTALYRGSISSCLSNCGKFGYYYEWCFTTENYDWDYCSSKLESASNVYGYNIYGRKCIDECVADKHSATKCHSKSLRYRICARPARLPDQSLSNILWYGGRPKRALDRLFATNVASTRGVRDGRDGEAQHRIDAIYNSGIIVENITSFQPNSPYTFVATTNATNARGDIVHLPLIVMASLTKLKILVSRQSSDIPKAARDNVNNQYNGNRNSKVIDVGHIIAFQNGGTRDLFNFVGQTSACNKGPYKMIENVVNNWINYNGTVEMTVVITYRGTVADEFTVKLKLFNDDGTLSSDCLDNVIKNN